MEKWIEEGWLVHHDPAVHGQPAAVLPLLAHVQEHKETTPVRPCLYYRCLNDCLSSQPGFDMPAYGETLRKCRQVREPEAFKLLDIKKAYPRVHVAADLLRYQTVVWKGDVYVMTQMGFGLSIAPKFMNIIVQWATRDLPLVENYVDDVLSPSDHSDRTASCLLDYDLPTKPAESLAMARALGLQLQ